MLVSSIARFQAEGQRSIDRYAAWSAAKQQLRDDWNRGAYPPASELNGYLHSVPNDQKCEAMQDLIAEHMALAWRAGKGECLEHYMDAMAPDMPELTSADSLPAELVEDEFLARYQSPHVDAPSVAEYRQRFATRADVLHLLEARTLGGERYTKLRSLGRGGMGEVWEAYDGHLRRRVAIKQPITDAASPDAALSRFAREARITARLEHPGIVSLHEFYSDGEPTPCYVMRLVEGVTLGEAIRDYYARPDQRRAENRICWQRLLRAFAFVCETIEYAHAQGVLHRDLTPGNIIVEPFGEATVLDWGAATTCNNAIGGRDERDGTIVGTPEYMPPEQTDGVARVESDVFGLGAVLYELLTCRAPHIWPDGLRPDGWRDVVRQSRLLPPSHYRHDVEPELESICMKALARDTDQRYRTAGDLATDVRRYQANEPLLGCPETLWSKARRWIRRLGNQ
jgi:hypothetical protein